MEITNITSIKFFEIGLFSFLYAFGCFTRNASREVIGVCYGSSIGQQKMGIIRWIKEFLFIKFVHNFTYFYE